MSYVTKVDNTSAEKTTDEGESCGGRCNWKATTETPQLSMREEEAELLLDGEKGLRG